MTRIVALTRGSPQSWIVLNALASVFGPITVLTEVRDARRVLIRRRVKRVGGSRVVGQAGFTLVQRTMARLSGARIAEIVLEAEADLRPSADCEVIPVGSVNSDACRRLLAARDPAVVVVFGTRVIGAKTLAVLKVPILNLHSGINPKYRGQAGGYWALALGDPEHAGVTVHLVDAGVDTGEVLYQDTFKATARDNYNTYFYLQAAALRPLAVKAVGDALAGTLRPFKPDMPSEQYVHPTLWFYLWTGFTRGVW